MLEAVSGIEPTDEEPGVRTLHLTAPPMDGGCLATGLPVPAVAPEVGLPDTDGTVIALSRLCGQPWVPTAIYRDQWCGPRRMVRWAQDRTGRNHEYVDLDRHPHAQRKLLALSGGRRRTRAVHAKGDRLMRPSLQQVQARPVRHGATW